LRFLNRSSMAAVILGSPNTCGDPRAAGRHGGQPYCADFATQTRPSTCMRAHRRRSGTMLRRLAHRPGWPRSLLHAHPSQHCLHHVFRPFACDRRQQAHLERKPLATADRTRSFSNAVILWAGVTPTRSRDRARSIAPRGTTSTHAKSADPVPGTLASIPKAAGLYWSR
jgi:hypothetical protein